MYGTLWFCDPRVGGNDPMQEDSDGHRTKSLSAQRNADMVCWGRRHKLDLSGPVYPTAWTMTATGQKDGNPSWTGNATGAGTLAVSSDAQGMHFRLTNSQIVVQKAFMPQMWAAYEWQFAEIIQPIHSNNQVNGSNTDTMHTHSCDAPIAPGTAVCTVVCTWNMQKQ